MSHPSDAQQDSRKGLHPLRFKTQIPMISILVDLGCDHRPHRGYMILKAWSKGFEDRTAAKRIETAPREAIDAKFCNGLVLDTDSQVTNAKRTGLKQPGPVLT